MPKTCGEAVSISSWMTILSGNLGMKERLLRFSLHKAFFEGSLFLVIEAKGVGEEVRGRLSGHGFSTEASLLICGSKAAGGQRGMALLVAGRSPRRGGGGGK